MTKVLDRIPIVKYCSDMGWYSEEKASIFRTKLSKVSSIEEQMKKIGIRKSEKYEDGAVKCRFIQLLKDSVHPIQELVIDEYGTIIGIKFKGKYLLIGNKDCCIDVPVVRDFFGTYLGDEIYETVLSDEQRKQCLICKDNMLRPCNPWYHPQYLDCFGKTPEGDESLSWDLVEYDPFGNIACLISKHAVAAVPFLNLSRKQNGGKWRDCYYSESDLKKWLEHTFLYEFFSEEERKKIQSVDIPNVSDIEKWFPEDCDRICTATQYAINNGAVIFKNNATINESCVYWLSDTGRKAGMSASVVLSNGKIYKSAYMAADNVCVRPVIKVIRKEQW